MVGDGEAETGPLATELALATNSSTRRRDGAVLPILHLNGYKIANPTVLARIPHDELDAAVRAATATTPYFVEGDDPTTMHAADGGDARHRRSATSDAIQTGARERRRHRAARAGR